jgi:hypothetical protein
MPALKRKNASGIWEYVAPGAVGAGSVIVTVTHGTDADAARPSDAAVVCWLGSVYPNESIATDLWIDDSASGVSAIEPTNDLYLTARQLTNPTGSPTLTGASSTGHPVWNLDAATVERVGSVIPRFPAHWTTYNIDLWWTNSGAGSGDVVWRYDYLNVSDGDSLDTLTSASQVVAAAPAQNILEVTSLATGLAVPAAGDALSATVLRNASSAFDTLANDASVYLLHLSKAS